MAGKERKSASSLKSKDSLSSMGIGASAEPSVRLKIIPDGLTNADDRLYDCILALIFCPEHRKVAVINTRRENIIWTPFLQLREGQSWRQGAIDCIEQAIGRQDAELAQVEAAKQAPAFELTYLEVTEIQVPSVGSIVRVCQLATLKRGGPFKCCTKGPQMDWIPLMGLLDDQQGNGGAHWGPELQVWAGQLERSLTRGAGEPAGRVTVMSQRTVAQELSFFASDAKDSVEFKAMQAIKLRASHAMEIYEEYLKHCYPSLYMKRESLRLYLSKYAYPTGGGSARERSKSSKKNKPTSKGQAETEAAKWTQLYDLFRVKGREFLDFGELLCGLVAMDPHTKDKTELRIRTLFRFYAKGRPAFNEESLRFLASHLMTSSKISQVEAASKLLRLLEVPNPEKVTYGVFSKAVLSHSLDVSKLLRFERSVLVQTSPTFGRKMTPLQPTERKTLKPTDLGDQCLACREKHYEYGMHVVTVGNEGLTEKSIIDQGWLNDARYPVQRAYSVDYTFSNSANANTLLDLVRSFNRTKAHLRCSKGLMSVKEEIPSFIGHLQRLCRNLNGILSAEPKLLHLNGPAFVFGDLQGNLDSLLTMADTLFGNFPVIPESLVFLGNYSGVYPYGVEVLTYLFALKACQPNKVFLLRGNAETTSKASNSLRVECYDKYGRQKGQLIWQTFSEVFAKLPLAVVIDETILAVHSGIPKRVRKIADMMAKLPSALGDLQKEAPFAYELLTRYPLSYRHNDEDSLITVDDELLMGEFPGDPAFHSAERSATLRISSCKSLDSSKSGGALLAPPVTPKSKSAVMPKKGPLTRSRPGLGNTKLTIRPSSTSIRSIKTNAPEGPGGTSSSGAGKSRTGATVLPKTSKSKLKPSKPSMKQKSHSLSGKLSRAKSVKQPVTPVTPLTPMARCEASDLAKSVISIATNHTTISKAQQPSSTSFSSLNQLAKSVDSVRSIKSGKTSLRSWKTCASTQGKDRASLRSIDSSTPSTYKILSDGTTSTISSTFPGDSSYRQCQRTFDGAAFVDFMSANGLRYLLRSSSVCKYGFKRNFKDRCLTIFSCPNVGEFLNEAAVLLVDRSTGVLRFLGFTKSGELAHSELLGMATGSFGTVSEASNLGERRSG